MDDLVAGGDEADAFLIGNQGPDIILFSRALIGLQKFRDLGNTMHDKKPTELIWALWNSLSILEGEDREIGRAYALGFLCHYLLDSTVHPLVYGQVYQLCDAGVPGLSRDEASQEVHGVIETDFDEMVLLEKRAETVETFSPSERILRAPKHVLDVVSLMYSYIALTVYGMRIPKDMYSRSFAGYHAIERLLYSPKGGKRAVLSTLERIGRPNSMYDAMSHRAKEHTTSEFDNHEHRVWENPFTFEKTQSSFWDLYNHALWRANDVLTTFDKAHFSKDDAQEITHGIDFCGRPTHAILLSVEDA